VRDDEVMLGTYGNLHIVANDARLADGRMSASIPVKWTLNSTRNPNAATTLSIWRQAI